MQKSLQDRIEELVREEISILPYNPEWPAMFDQEAAFLRRILPRDIMKRIEHFGSTAVPGLSAKPIIDILVEVSNLDDTKEQIVPKLEKEGYEYFWRPVLGDQPPYYAWFIKRNAQGVRTHHIHMVEADSELWERLQFRDYLQEFPDEARRYDELKRTLAGLYPRDRVAYTKRKTEYIAAITRKAKEYFSAHQRKEDVKGHFRRQRQRE